MGAQKIAVPRSFCWNVGELVWIRCIIMTWHDSDVNLKRQRVILGFIAQVAARSAGIPVSCVVGCSCTGRSRTGGGRRIHRGTGRVGRWW